jgi:hypothetical protein
MSNNNHKQFFSYADALLGKIESNKQHDENDEKYKNNVKEQYFKTYEPLITYTNNVKQLELTKFNNLTYSEAVLKIEKINAQLENELITFQNICEHKYHGHEYFSTSVNKATRDCEVCYKRRVHKILKI